MLNAQGFPQRGFKFIELYRHLENYGRGSTLGSEEASQGQDRLCNSGLGDQTALILGQMGTEDGEHSKILQQAGEANRGG